MNFEESIEKLEKVVNELENGELNLEDSIKKFEEGMELSKKCNEILENAEKKITMLIKKMEVYIMFELIPFDRTFRRVACFDPRVTDYLIQQFKGQEGIDLSNDKMALQRLKEAAEKAKKELSSATTTNINLPFITATADGPKHLDMTLTRAKFDELTHDLVEATAVPVQNATSPTPISAIFASSWAT